MSINRRELLAWVAFGGIDVLLSRMDPMNRKIEPKYNFPELDESPSPEHQMSMIEFQDSSTIEGFLANSKNVANQLDSAGKTFVFKVEEEDALISRFAVGDVATQQLRSYNIIRADKKGQDSYRVEVRITPFDISKQNEVDTNLVFKRGKLDEAQSSFSINLQEKPLNMKGEDWLKMGWSMVDDFNNYVTDPNSYNRALNIITRKSK